MRSFLVALCIVLSALAAAAGALGYLGTRGSTFPHGPRAFRAPIAVEAVIRASDGVGRAAESLAAAGDAVAARALAAADRLAAVPVVARARSRAVVLLRRAGWLPPEPVRVIITAVEDHSLQPRAASELSGFPPAASVVEGRIKTAEELKVEQLIADAFKTYFREYTVGGVRLTLRMPFALEQEREGGRHYAQAFYREGKGTPEELWPYIDSVLASKRFARYVKDITSTGDKVVIFALARRSYLVSRSRNLLEALGMEVYPGTPTRIFVRRDASVLSGSDIYNYLYAIAAVGVDCSGFAFHVQQAIARQYGLDLEKPLAKKWRVKSRAVRQRVGLWFYSPASGFTEKISDSILDLRPGDMILFRGSDGKLKHSAVIQSIDLREGLIRYVQSTDWALEDERGVHMSMIRFDPSRPRVGLRHHSVRWLQQVRPPFEGEEEPRDWLTDGDRYMWYTEAGGSMVVRPRELAAAFLGAEPRYYTTIAPTASSTPASP